MVVLKVRPVKVTGLPVEYTRVIRERNWARHGLDARDCLGLVGRRDINYRVYERTCAARPW